MLALTRRAEYALIALCHLARVDGGVVSARDIAERYVVPLPLLMNLLKTLSRGGFVRSIRGAHGGYKLAVPAEQITLARLLETIEGPLRLVRCIEHVEPRDEPCELVDSCPIRHPVGKLHEKLRRFLDDVTIAELAFDEDFGELSESRHPLNVLAR